MSKKVTHLVQQFKPEHYVLNLLPDKKTMTFTGSVTIKGKKIGRPSQRLTLHQKDLKILTATITHHDKHGDHAVEVDRINAHDTYDEVRLHTTKLLYGGSYTITLEFSGTITRPMNGLYPCYFTEGKTEKMLLATQFESHHAREVFPCIDEPAAKATFDLSLTTPKGEIVLANTPIKTQRSTAKGMHTTFDTTPVMSTYLLAFVYGDLKYKEATTKGGVTVRTYATPENVDFTDFALDIAVKCLDFYSEYFDIPYPLPKCDFIALPDFASGAMENWGCITFREQCLLVDPANTSLSTRQYVAMVVAHELAHMWFGNLVTMCWWTDLWLNEGFASWIEYLAVDHIFPEWQMWTQFITDEQQIAFKLDALENTHPIEVAIKHPDEIRTIFDNISYSKGSSVIHMLNAYLGADTFRGGLRHYLKTHAYGNTDTVDLWQALEHTSGKPVKNFMHHWTSQPGFPIVTAHLATDNPQLSQARFYLQKPHDAKHTLWSIPLLPNVPLGISTLDKATKKITASSLDASMLLNADRSGFYRVVYDSEHTAALGKQVEAGKLSPINRLGLLSDSFEAVKANHSPTTDALQLLASYVHEDNSAVWDIIAGNIGAMRTVMGDDTLREAMKPYVRNLVADQLKRLDWKAKKDEPYFDSLLRPTILGLASMADEPSVVAECLQRYKAAKKPEDIEPDLRGVILGTVARHGDLPEFKQFAKWHDASSSSEVRTTLAAAMTGFKQPVINAKALAMIITDNVRLQDVSYWVAYSFMNRYARDDTWQWMIKHWDWLEKNLGTDLAFSRFPLYAARVQSNKAFLKEYTAFFNKVSSPALDRSIKQGAEIILWQADWKTRDYKSVLDFFQA